MISIWYGPNGHPSFTHYAKNWEELSTIFAECDKTLTPIDYLSLPADGLDILMKVGVNYKSVYPIKVGVRGEDMGKPGRKIMDYDLWYRTVILQLGTYIPDGLKEKV